MIGAYVHHSGIGHLTLARALVQHTAMPVTVLSSLPRPADWPGGWVDLPLDTDETRPDNTAPGPDATARGALHWAPFEISGYRTRMRIIADWITRTRPAAMLVDVSAEVVMLSRLLGVPTATILMPGRRDDQPHRTAYAMADLLIGPWPRGVHEVDPALADRVVAVGSVSRFDGRDPLDLAPEPGRVLVLSGNGSIPISDDDIADASKAAGGDWRVCGGQWPSSTDLWHDLARAEIVVTFAGQNSIADVAAARRPAVVIAAPRPHGEQLTTVAALRRLRISAVADRWPAPDRWPALLDEARARGGQTWRLWSTGHGARTLAATLERFAGATAASATVSAADSAAADSAAADSAAWEPS